MKGLTASCGEFASACRSAPSSATDRATIGIVDAIGTMIAGRNEPVVQAVLAECETTECDAADRTGGASVLMSTRTTRPVEAALVNATAAHVLAMDDVAVGCHPSAILMPGLLAEAEAIGASGAEVLVAYVVGFEILAELASREPDALHETGWHPTGLLGAVAVAGAIGNLRRMTAEQCTRALGIAASTSGGLQANFGTPTKALHAGRVAANGVWAAHLAAAGVGASPTALEHPKGLLRTVSPAGRVDVDGDLAVGPAYRIVSIGLSIKKYPVCYSTHRLVDAAIDLSGSDGFDVDGIDRIEVRTGTRQAALAPHRSPTTVGGARYSIDFAVVSGLVAGAAGFAELTDAFIASPRVVGLMSRVTIELDDRASSDDPVFCPADRIVLWMKDGRVLDSGAVRFARGHASLPLSHEALRRKFIDCARRGRYERPEALYQRAIGIADLKDLRQLATPSCSSAAAVVSHARGTGTIISSAR